MAEEKIIDEIIKLRELTERLDCRDSKILSAVSELEHAFDAIGDVVIIVDVDHKIKYANKSALNKFKLTKKELNGYGTCRDLICNSLDSKCMEDKCPLMSTNFKVEEKEGYFGGKLDGWYRRTRSVITNGDDKIIGAICIFKDISDRKNIEDKLRRNEKKFSLLLDHVPMGVFMKDSNFETIYVNKYMIERLNSDEYLGKTPLETFPKEVGEKMIEADKMTLEKGYYETIDVVPNLNGEYHTYKTCKFIIEDGDDSPMIGGVTVDISQNK